MTTKTDNPSLQDQALTITRWFDAPRSLIFKVWTQPEHYSRWLEEFIPYWASVAAKPDDPDFTSGQKFTDTHKVVFTKTLDTSVWDNTTLAKGDLINEINQLKQQDGQDIIAYGGAAFVSALIKEELIDEFHLFVNPTALGNGMPIFKKLNRKLDLTLVKAIPFDCGIVVLNYEPKRG